MKEYAKEHYQQKGELQAPMETRGAALSAWVEPWGMPGWEEIFHCFEKILFVCGGRGGIWTYSHELIIFGWGSGSKLQRSAWLCPLHLCAGVVGTDHHSRLLHGFWGSELKSLSMYNKHLTKKTTPSQPSLGINFLNRRLRTCVCSYSLELWGGRMLCMHKTSTLKHISG